MKNDYIFFKDVKDKRNDNLSVWSSLRLSPVSTYYILRKEVPPIMRESTPDVPIPPMLGFLDSLMFFFVGGWVGDLNCFFGLKLVL